MLAGLLVHLALDVYCAMPRDPELGRRVIGFYDSKMPPGQAVAIADYVLEPFGGQILEYETDRVVKRWGVPLRHCSLHSIPVPLSESRGEPKHQLNAFELGKPLSSCLFQKLVPRRRNSCWAGRA